MKKLMILAVLFCYPAFSHTLILSKHITSGEIQPENSFVKDCKVFSEGFVVITKKQGTSAPQSHNHSVSRRTILTIRQLIRTARNGRIEVVGATCDGGDQILNGYYRSLKVLLDENIDCGEHKVNQSKATPILARMARRICGF